MTDKKVRLGIIGLGAEGGMYAGLLAQGKVPNMQLGAIADIDPDKKAKADELGAPFYDDYLAMIESGDVDAIVTCVPHYLHPEMGIEALKRGMHTLLEKPVGVYTAQAREVIDFAATKPELTFGVFFNQRTNPLYVDLKALIESGELGALRHTSWIITNWWRPQGYYDQSAWRATWGGEGGGVLVNQAPHQLDLWQWLCGVPTSCFAKLAFGFRRDIAVEDEVNAIVDFGNGATGHFMTATHDLIGTDRLEILFDKGKIVVDNSKTVTVTGSRMPSRSCPRACRWTTCASSSWASSTPRACTRARPPSTSRSGAAARDGAAELRRERARRHRADRPGADGINGVRLANAMHLSAWTGEEVDMVDFDEQRYFTELNARIRAEGKFERV
jgi:predicted dehydrogenase